MAKSKRGRAIWNVPSHGRGTCPVCKATRIKLLYPRTKSDGKSIKVCKRCSVAPVSRLDEAVAEIKSASESKLVLS
ncbi:hypothetical protein [Cohnella fermenti]|uniref:Uncharacterized protein n=1 Tax=Cohnella fermenti TaxID=2565925 RepID=A0A4S4BXV1_9BACL|nr:hypothetical protein [Cohnella fermenti]THF79537.1 hypothetical protein E6C55_12195 [Cohnella fermenti]